MKEKEIERLNCLKEFENNLHINGVGYIAGIDEAGRGPLAGPVVVQKKYQRKKEKNYMNKLQKKQ